ncbi:MAG: Rossmann-like domain-containing protein [Caldisericaceae bacterium]
MKNLYEDLIASVKLDKTSVVRDVRAGITWTGVSASRVGLSLTYSSILDNIEEGGSLKGKPVYELLEYLKTFNLVKLSIGLAALNSVIEPSDELETFNVINYIEEKSIGKKVVFVGHFCGLEKVRQNSRELTILERNPKEGDVIDTAAYYLIPEADIVAITGSTFANKSIENILSLCKGQTIVFGPSTPLSTVLFDYGVDIIGGSIVVDEEKVLSAISEGGHLSNFKKYLKYVVMRRK